MRINFPQQVKLQLTFFNQKMFPLFAFKLATFQSVIPDPVNQQNKKEANLDITIKQLLNHLLSNGLFELIQKQQSIIGLNQQTELQHIRFEVSYNQSCKSDPDQKTGSSSTKTKILKLNDNINSIRYNNNNQCFSQEIIHLQIKIKIQTEIQQQKNKVTENVEETNLQTIKNIQEKIQLVQIVQRQTNIFEKQEDQGSQMGANQQKFLKVQEEYKEHKQQQTKIQFQDKLIQGKESILNNIQQENKQKNDFEQISKFAQIKQKNINKRPIVKLSKTKLEQLMSKQNGKQNKQLNLLKRKNEIQTQQYKKDDFQSISLQKEKEESQVVQLCKVIFYEINDSEIEGHSNLRQLQICNIKKMTILKNKILTTHDVFFDQNAQNPINRVNIILKDINLYCIKKQSKTKNKFDNNFIQNQEGRNKQNDMIFLSNVSNNNSKALQKSQSIFQTQTQTEKNQVNQKDAFRIQKFRERTILKSSSLHKFNKHKLGRFKSEQTISNHSQEPVEVQTINTMEQFVQHRPTELNHHQRGSQKVIQNQNFLIKTKKNDFSLKRNPESPKKSTLSPLKKYKNQQTNQLKHTKQVKIQELLVDKLFTNKSQEYNDSQISNQLTPNLTKINSQNIVSQNNHKKQQKNKQSIFKIRKQASLLKNVLKIIEEQTQKKNPIIIRQNTNHLGFKNIIENQADQYSRKNTQLKQKTNIKRIKSIFNAYCTPLTLQKSKSHKN